MIHIEFDTNEYVLEHGRLPSGHGMWAFEVYGNHIIWAPTTMTLTEAKRWFKACVRAFQSPRPAYTPRRKNERRMVVVNVCP